MKLTVVGCAGSYPSATSPGSCYLLEHEGQHLLLDLGNGALGALQNHIDIDDPASLAGLVLSHCHIDHCADTASMFVQRHYHPHRTFAPLPLLGPDDTHHRLTSIYGMHDPSMLDTVFDLRRLADCPATIGPFEIRATPAAHPVEAFSVRVTAGGRSITYSGDSALHPGLVELALGTDIALFEASFVGHDNPPNLHMSGADAGRAGTEAGAALLLLTHLVAWNDDAKVIAEATAAYSGALEVARPGMTITL